MKIKISTEVNGHYDGSLRSADEDVLLNFQYFEEYTTHLDEDEESQIIEEPDSPGRVIKTCFVNHLKKCLYQFHILRRMYTPLAKPEVIRHIRYETLNQRLGDCASSYADVRLDSPYTDAHKLQRDVAFVIFLLETVIDEANKWGTFSIFSENVDTLLQQKQDEEDLLNQMREKRELLRQIRRAIVREKQMSNAGAKTYNEALRNQAKRYQDVSACASAEMKYTKNWEDSRYEQNRLKLSQKESLHKNCAFGMQYKIELEEICHQQFEDFMVLSKKECAEQIQYWMQNYDSDFDKKELEIYDLRLQMEKLREQHEAMKQEYETRVQMMEDWLEYKRKKKEQEELEAEQFKAAIKIQAWWRGVMFRRKLGPYRKKKSKGKRGKKTGKAKRSDR